MVYSVLNSCHLKKMTYFSKWFTKIGFWLCLSFQMMHLFGSSLVGIYIFQNKIRSNVCFPSILTLVFFKKCIIHSCDLGLDTFIIVFFFLNFETVFHKQLRKLVKYFVRWCVESNQFHRFTDKCVLRTNLSPSAFLIELDMCKYNYYSFDWRLQHIIYNYRWEKFKILRMMTK